MATPAERRKMAGMEDITPSNIIVDKDIETAVLEVLREARQVAILVSPIVKVWDALLDEVRTAAGRDVRVVVVCKNGNKDSELAALRQTGATVRQVRSLHAKMAMNEFTVLVMSTDLQEHPSKNARSVAVRVTDVQDIIQARRYVVHDLLGGGTYHPMLIPSEQPQTRPCIDCGTLIPYEAYQPRCPRCYSEWRDRRHPAPNGPVTAEQTA